MSENTVFLPVDAAYDRWSASYDTYDNPMVFTASQVVELSLTEVRGLDVFEFGCGTGRNLAVLKRRGARILSGCDVSEGMLAIARRRDPEFRLIRHDMELPVPQDSGSADLVLFCLSLEHMENLLPPLIEARRIVRRGGRVQILEIHPLMSLGGVAAHFRDGGEEVRMPAFPHQFAAYLSAFSKSDLRIEACREWRPCDLGTPAPLKALKRGPDFPLVVEFSLCG